MNIIKSSYNSNTLKEFKKQEFKKIGEDNYKLVQKIEKLINILFYILISLLLSSLVIPAIIFKDNAIAVPLSLILILVFGIIICKLLNCDENGINKITVKIMNKKNILYSPVLNKNYDFIYENHKTLIEMYEFVQNNKTASFMPYNYNGYNGWIQITYNDGIYNKIKEFHIDESLIKFVLKEDKVDCSYLDKYIKEFLEYNQ